MSDELETTGVGTATETDVRDDGDVSTHTETAEDTTGDDAALATLNKAFEEHGGDEVGEEPEGDQPEQAAEGSEAGEGGETAEAAIEPELIAAASFAGLEEKDLRDAIAAVGKDKAVAMIQSLVTKASERWGIEATGQQQATQQTEQQPQQQTQKPPAEGDPFAAFEAPDFAKELIADFPEAKPLVESTRQIARIARQQQEVMGQMAQMISHVWATVDGSEAADMMEFMREVDPEGKVYGDPMKEPTPEQLSARKRLNAGARQYQRTGGRPMRFASALRDTHTALTIGSAKATSKTQAVEAAAKKRDVMPKSAGTAAPKASSSQAMDAAALQTLRTKYGLK